MECFEGESCNFECDTIFDGEPVKLVKGWGDVVIAFE